MEPHYERPGRIVGALAVVASLLIAFWYVRQVGVAESVKAAAFFTIALILLLIGAGVWGFISKKNFPTIKRIIQRVNRLLANNQIQLARRALRVSWNIVGWLLILPLLVFYVSETIAGPLDEQPYTYRLVAYLIGSGICYLVICFLLPTSSDREPLSAVLHNKGTVENVFDAGLEAFLRYIGLALLAPIYFLLAMFVIGANTINGAIGLYLFIYVFILMCVIALLPYWEQEETYDGET